MDCIFVCLNYRLPLFSKIWIRTISAEHNYGWECSKVQCEMIFTYEHIYKTKRKWTWYLIRLSIAIIIGAVACKISYVLYQVTPVVLSVSRTSCWYSRNFRVTLMPCTFHSFSGFCCKLLTTELKSNSRLLSSSVSSTISIPPTWLSLVSILLLWLSSVSVSSTLSSAIVTFDRFGFA